MALEFSRCSWSCFVVDCLNMTFSQEDVTATSAAYKRHSDERVIAKSVVVTKEWLWSDVWIVSVPAWGMDLQPTWDSDLSGHQNIRGIRQHPFWKERNSNKCLCSLQKLVSCFSLLILYNACMLIYEFEVKYSRQLQCILRWYVLQYLFCDKV